MPVAVFGPLGSAALTIVWEPPVKRSEIETVIARYVNRSDLNDMVPMWFNFAYLEIQRFQDFKAMEHTAQVDLVENISMYTVPENYKRITRVIQIEKSTSKIVTFYNGPVDIEDIDMLNYQGSDSLECRPAVFAIRENQIHLYPSITSVADRAIKIRHYRFLTPPEPDRNDFFTNVAPDYLVYRALSETAPFLGADKRLETWDKLLAKATTSVLKLGTAQVWDGPLIMRG